jgi:hypothetical protein
MQYVIGEVRKMQNQTTTTQTPNQTSRPRYETPKIQAMTEKEILNSFQITQSMGGWWVTPTC